MRSLLVDWMSEVCAQYRLQRVTYHLAVALTDRLLAASPRMAKVDLQLAGATALFMAAKIEVGRTHAHTRTHTRAACA